VSIRRIFENENWVVVEKPAGWLTTPARTKDDPRPCLGLTLQAEFGRQIYPVHRLDFEVGGLVLFALNAACHRVACGWFEHGVVVKTYSALSVPGSGEPPREWQEWRSKLARGKKRSYVSAHGKDSVTEARVVDVVGAEAAGGGRIGASAGGGRVGDGQASAGVGAGGARAGSGRVLAGIGGARAGDGHASAGEIAFWQWELRPRTGRPHQLRVELANRGAPILGDVLYGGPPGDANSIALTAVALDLEAVPEEQRAGLPVAVKLGMGPALTPN